MCVVRIRIFLVFFGLIPLAHRVPHRCLTLSPLTHVDDEIINQNFRITYIFFIKTVSNNSME